MFLLNVYGATHAENKVALVQRPRTRFGRGRALPLDEQPLRRRAHDEQGQGTEYNIQVDADDAEKPVAMVRFELARLGARSINTIPITSSIPGIKVIR
jgi:hypothetical protein